MKKIIWLFAFIAVIAIIAFTTIYRFFLSDDKELVNFNYFPTELLENREAIKIVELEIAENLQNARISEHILPLKNGWVTIGIVKGIVSTIDPEPRTSNPMNYLLFEFPGSEGQYFANGLIEMPVKDGSLQISVNKAYFDKLVYSAIPDGDNYVYGKIKLAVYNHQSYQNHGSPATKLQIPQQKTEKVSVKGKDGAGLVNGLVKKVVGPWKSTNKDGSKKPSLRDRFQIETLSKKELKEVRENGGKTKIATIKILDKNGFEKIIHKEFAVYNDKAEKVITISEGNDGKHNIKIKEN